jgi:hypothetical protein
LPVFQISHRWLSLACFPVRRRRRTLMYTAIVARNLSRNRYTQKRKTRN